MVFEIIAFLALTGIAKVLAANLQKKAGDEYQLFLDKSKKYTRNINEAKREIEKEIRNANMQRFHELCNLHYRSFQIANDAKQALDHARNTLGIFYDTRSKCYDNLEKLSQDYTEQRTLKNWDQIEQIKNDQASLKELKNSLHGQIDIIIEKRDSFYGELKELNNKTSELKFHIKNCGSKGEDWFKRLEERTNQRRLTF